MYLFIFKVKDKTFYARIVHDELIVSISSARMSVRFVPEGVRPDIMAITAFVTKLMNVRLFNVPEPEFEGKPLMNKIAEYFAERIYPGGSGELGYSIRASKGDKFAGAFYLTFYPEVVVRLGMRYDRIVSEDVLRSLRDIIRDLVTTRISIEVPDVLVEILRRAMSEERMLYVSRFFGLYRGKIYRLGDKIGLSFRGVPKALIVNDEPTFDFGGFMRPIEGRGEEFSRDECENVVVNVDVTGLSIIETPNRTIFRPLKIMGYECRDKYIALHFGTPQTYLLHENELELNEDMRLESVVLRLDKRYSLEPIYELLKASV